jgi:hypothetical protein
MERRLLIALFIVLLIYFNYPKTMFEVGEDLVTTCDCLGFGFYKGEQERGCIGLTFDCRDEYVEQIQSAGFTQSKIKKVCVRKSCDSFESYLGIAQEKAEKEKEENLQLNMMFVMDTSYSMIGEKI